MMDEDFTFPLLGSGVVDWQAFAEALDDVGFDGFMSVEFEAFRYYKQVLKDDPAKAAALSMEQIKGLFGA
jgi:sugar phosphate isomerase/epimerase